MHVQSVSELWSKVNYVATRLRHLETIRWHVEWKLPPNELSPKIVLIYALLLLKCRESYLRAFLIHNLNFARLFARLTPVFLLKKRPSFARLFTKMSPSEELVTLGLSGLQSADLATPTSNCWGSVTGWRSGGSVRGWERDMAQQGEVQCHCQLCFCQTDDWTAAGNGFFGTLISPKDWSAPSNDRTQLTMMYRDNWIRN